MFFFFPLRRWRKNKQNKLTTPNVLFFLPLSVPKWSLSNWSQILSIYIQIKCWWISKDGKRVEAKPRLDSFGDVCDNHKPDAQNFWQEGLACSSSLTLLSHPFIFLSQRQMASHRQWLNSIFICFLLFGFHCREEVDFHVSDLPQQH